MATISIQDKIKAEYDKKYEQKFMQMSKTITDMTAENASQKETILMYEDFVRSIYNIASMEPESVTPELKSKLNNLLNKIR